MTALPNFQMLPERVGPWAFGYGRQSHRQSIDAGEAIPQQGIRTKAYFTAQLEPRGVQWGGFIPDESAVSARVNPFMLRHAGRTLFDLMRPGDHFIVDKVDRLWRSVADFVDVRRQFEQRKVSLHICSLMGATSVQLGTPAGDFLINILVAGAQMESDQCSDRTKARFAGRRAEGRYPGSRTPLGCKLLGKVEKVGNRVISDTRHYAWDMEYRRFMGEIVRLADEGGKSASEISKMISSHIRQLMGEEFFRKVIVGERGKAWDSHTIVRHYWREKQYQALPWFNPNTVRFSAFDPPNSTPFRDIGKNEPNTPNPYPFLDGKTPPTLAALQQLAT